MIKIKFDRFVDPISSGPSVQADDMVLAHRHCAAHRSEVLRSELCGCFSCLKVFTPSEINEWIEETGGVLATKGDPWTAICPNCGIDAVVGTASGFPVDRPSFLESLNKRWFRNAQD